MVWFTIATRRPRLSFLRPSFSAHAKQSIRKNIKKTMKKVQKIIYSTADYGALSNETAAIGNRLRGQTGGSRWAA
jgi:trans-2-enoyl-CoA reductase